MTISFFPVRHSDERSEEESHRVKAMSLLLLCHSEWTHLCGSEESSCATGCKSI
ncbi:MAG: hypothetical protein OIF36_02620 [Alphaproteobacteria bacterium]|nr:hypothetical protein [Alphaproteobacteria bacterium]